MTVVSMLKLADLRTVATETFSIERLRGNGSWVAITCTKTTGMHMQPSRIGELLPCTREPGNHKDPFAVAVVRLSVTVSQQLRTID